MDPSTGSFTSRTVFELQTKQTKIKTVTHHSHALLELPAEKTGITNVLQHKHVAKHILNITASLWPSNVEQWMPQASQEEDEHEAIPVGRINCVLFKRVN